MKTVLRTCLAAAIVVLAGCPTDPAGDTGPLTFPDCEAIVDACHYVDDGSPGMISTCHDTAHDATSNADCAPLRASCLAACEAVDGGMGHDDEDAPGHSHDEDAPDHSHDEDAPDHSHDEDGVDGGTAP